MKPKLNLKPPVCPKVLFITGLGRAGKSMVAPLVSNLGRVEYYQVLTEADHIPHLLRVGLIDDHTAKALLQMSVDVHIYDRIIGRNMNSRLADSTSVHNALDAPALLERRSNTDGMEAVTRFNDDRRIPCISTHMAMITPHLFFAAFPGLKIVQQVRHPVDVASSWFHRGWGHRHGTDPTSFSLMAESENGSVPWFAVGSSIDYGAMSPMDRVVWAVMNFLDATEQGVGSLTESEKSQVFPIAFERLATDPWGELQSIAEWLGTEVPPRISEVMARERVPRELDRSDRKEKVAHLKQEASKDLFERLMAASQTFEKRWESE